MPSCIPQRPDIADWELRVVATVVRSVMRGQQDIGGHDAEDLSQMALMHWWEKRGAFLEVGSASAPTYMRRVVENKLLEIVAGVRAEKRGQGSRPFSLDVAFGEGEDETLQDFLPDRSLASDVEATAISNERRFAVERFRAYQAPADQQLIDALRLYGDVRKSSRALNMPPSTVYGRLARMRPNAETQGLREHL